MPPLSRTQCLSSSCLYALTVFLGSSAKLDAHRWSIEFALDDSIFIWTCQGKWDLPPPSAFCSFPCRGKLCNLWSSRLVSICSSDTLMLQGFSLFIIHMAGRVLSSQKELVAVDVPSRVPSNLSGKNKTYYIDALCHFIFLISLHNKLVLSILM